MLKTVLVIFAASLSYTLAIIADVVMTPFHLMNAFMNTEKEKME